MIGDSEGLDVLRGCGDRLRSQLTSVSARDLG
jgi:hypothetical protein